MPLTFSGQLVASFPLAMTGKKTKPLTAITGLAAATMKYYLLNISDQLPSQLSQVSSMCTVCNRIPRRPTPEKYVIGANFHFLLLAPSGRIKSFSSGLDRRFLGGPLVQTTRNTKNLNGAASQSDISSMKDPCKLCPVETFRDWPRVTNSSRAATLRM